MRWGFTKGGFVVLDDVRRIGDFAYATSPHWERAKRGHDEAVAREMLAAYHTGPAYEHLREERYLRLEKEWESSVRYPVACPVGWDHV